MASASCTPPTRDASEGEGPQRRSQQQRDKRLEDVVEAVGGGYCRLQMPLKPALAVRGTVAGHRLGALEGGDLPPFQCILAPYPPPPPHLVSTVSGTNTARQRPVAFENGVSNQGTWA